jgi:MFS family permease
MKDRGFLLLFGLVTAGLYLLFAFTSVTYWTLLLAVVLLTTSYLFIASAQNGLSSTIGQQHAMSGQVSAVWNIFISIPTVVSLLIGGGLSERLEHTDADRAGRILFLVGAAIMAAIAAYAVWKPESVFANIRSERESSTHPLADLKRLARHLPIYPALLIWLLWNFAPGSATPGHRARPQGAPGGGVADDRRVRRTHHRHRGRWHSGRVFKRGERVEWTEKHIQGFIGYG